MIKTFVDTHDNARFSASLGPKLYGNALRQLDAVVGNSSSGLYEAPSFGIPTVNIGDRQKGRLRAASVIDCTASRGAILDAIKSALRMDCRGVANPYGDGHASERILAVLKKIDAPHLLLQKSFVDRDAP